MGTGNVHEILERKRQEVLAWRDAWCALATRVGELIDPASGDAELNEATRRIVDAVSAFERGIEHPTVTLATTGTTSGGKSSLVNMLCGAELMPVDVQEMSAGTVAVRHADAERRVIVHETPNATWECGSWDVTHPAEVRGRLKGVMETYRELRNQNREPAAPSFEVLWPTALGALRGELLGLPESCQVKFLDLPGMKYLGDTKNAEVIRHGARRALCLVTINAEETDQSKIDGLLDEVIEQIKQLGGSPARMLFLLNRFDAFLRDDGGDAAGQKHAQEWQQRIRTRVADSLKEHAETASRIEVLPISSAPGRMALTVHWSDEREVRVTAMRAMVKQYRLLIRDEIIEELPGNPERWSDHDLSRVSREVLTTSRAEDFFAHLRAHATAHLPELLVGHLLSAIRDAAVKGLTTLDQILYGEMKKGEDTYEAEVRRLREARTAVRTLVDTQGKELSSFRDLADKINSATPIAEAAALAVKTFGADVNRLSPLYAWYAELGKSIASFFECIQQAIQTGGDPSADPSIIGLPPTVRAKVVQACRVLVAAGYGQYALNGKVVEVSTDADKKRLRDLNVGLNELSVALAEGLRCVFEQRLAVESARTQDALQYLLEVVVADTARKASTCAPELAGLHLLPPAIAQIKHRWRADFSFRSGFEISTVERPVEVGKRHEQVQTGTRRLWYTLWIVKEPVYETRVVPIHEMRAFDVTTIPKLAKVFLDFMEQARGQRPAEQFGVWFSQSIDEMLQRLDAHFGDSLSQYEIRLNEARERAGSEKQEHDFRWLPFRERLGELVNEFDPVGTIA